MFWGYTPALDLLREYFWWRGKAGSHDFGVVSSGKACPQAEAQADPDPPEPEPTGGVTITEITDEEDVEGPDADVHEGHVQEDDAPDDGGRRVVGELLLPGGGAPAQAAGLRCGEDGDRGHARERGHGAGGQPRPLPPADGAHAGRHVHLDGAVGLQPGDGDARRQRDHAVRAGQGPQLLPAPPAAQDHPGDAVHREEVMRRAGPAAPAADRCGAGDPFDLFRVDPTPDDSADDGDTLNILLVGGMDGRHVLKTLSRLHRHADSLAGLAGDGDKPQRPKPRVRLFVAETVMELVARQLLFILAALEPPDHLGRTEKVRLLMELAGNTLVRPSTALWLRNASRLLVELVTDEAALRRRLPLVDLSLLRHRDRDRLEEVFAFYQERPQSFRVGYHWDQRLRRHLGVRYDTRAGAFDWDYFMVLRDLQGGDRVCVHEYRHWRETGVAFTWLEAEQSEPNLTLAAGIVREGCRLLHAGYLGDIVTSPFIAFAVELEPEDAADVFKKANDQYATRSTDAAERHLNRIAFELQHQCDYQPSKEPPSASAGGVVLTRVTDESRLDPRAPPEDDDPTLRKVRRAADMLGYDPLPVDNAQVVFLSPKFLQSPEEGRTRFAGRFHAAVLGQGLGERQLDAALLAVLAPGAVVLVEGPRFLLQRADARRQSAEALLRRATDAGLAPLQDFNADKDDFAKFVVVDAG